MLDTKIQCKIMSYHSLDFGSCFFHRCDFRYWIKTPVDLGSKLRWILEKTPAHNVFVSQFGLRILKQLQCKIISCHSSDFGSGSKLQWILEKASAQNHFVSQFGLRVLEKTPVQIRIVSHFGLRILPKTRFGPRPWVHN